MFTKAKETGIIFDGLKIKGKIRKTIVRGEVVFSDGEVIGKPGYGTFVRPLSSYHS
jgi:dihydroorotase-like cyclic amidohydrolase